MNKSKHATKAMALPAPIAPFTDTMRGIGTLLFEAVQRFYEARMEKAQMRLAPTRHLTD